MATRQTSLDIWLGCITILWALQPLLWSQARGVFAFSLATALLAFAAWCFSLPVLMTWSGAVGLCNLTLALVLSAQAPNLWAGLSAGITLLAMLDGNHRFTYLRYCQITPGVLTAFLNVFVQLSGLTLAVGITLSLFIPMTRQSIAASAASVLTITGACLLIAFLSLFLLHTNRASEGLRREQNITDA
ncbi:MAG: hypothetical protein O7G88_04075 [bacterium]|nr:hypothetical protein [bacterium]